MFYIVIGIVLLLLSAGTIAVMVLFEIRDRRAGNIQQGKRLPKKPYSKAFLAVGTGTMKRHWLICQIPVLFVKNKSGRC